MSTRAAIVLLIASAVAVAALAVAYRHDPVAAWDESVARHMATSLPETVETLARPFSWVGGGLGMALVTIVAAAVLSRGHRVTDAAVVVLAYAGAQVSTQVLKAALDRPRPALGPAVDLPATAAFPSGHASTSLAVLVVTAVLLGRRRALLVAFALALLIGLSRVALGVHWTSDVLGGWSLGAAWVAACLLVRERRRARRYA